MTLRAPLWPLLAAAAVLAIFIGANWRFAHQAFTSHPGCISVDPELPAATPAC